MLQMDLGRLTTRWNIIRKCPHSALFIDHQVSEEREDFDWLERIASTNE